MGRNANSTSGSLSDLAKGSTSIITLTGRDAFTAGDPVFLDYQLGQVVARNTANATEALTAGSSSTYISHTVQVSATFGGGATSVFSDGSYVVVTSTQSTAAGQDNNHRITLTAFDKQGVQTAQQTKIVSGSNPPTHGVTAVTLTATTFAYCYVLNGNTSVVAIADKVLNTIAQGNMASTTVWALNATSDGVLVSGSTGVWKLSLANVLTQPVVGSFVAINEVCTNGTDIAQRQVGNWTTSLPTINRTEMFPISSGGLGLFSQTGNSFRYDRFNSDGTVRGTTNAATSLTTGLNVSIAVGASGNILWQCVSAPGTTWGILSDSGTVIKAATLIAASDGGNPYGRNCRCITDANGDFVFTWSSGAGVTINTNYVTAAAGTPKSGFPRTDSISGTTTKLFRLSTGIIHIISNSANLNQCQMTFINNAGTVVRDKAPMYLCNAYVINLIDLIAGTVFNDALYVWHGNNLASSIDTIAVIYKIDNTGTITTAFNSGAIAIDNVPNIFVDANEVKVFTGPYILRYRTSDLSYLGVHNQGWSGGYTTTTARFCVVKAGQQYILTHSLSSSTCWSPTASPWPVASMSSGEKTVLLGVAVSTSVAGGPVMVQTKGSAACNWNTVKSSFDQSAASPPGNAGAVLGSVVALKGIAGT